MFSTEYSIVAQNAANVAAILVGNLTVEDTDDLLAKFETIRNAVFRNTIALAETDTPPDRQSSTFTRRTGSPPRRTGGQDNPGDLIIRFGKHAGRTVAEVYELEPDYLTWMADNYKNDGVRETVARFLASRKTAPAAPAADPDDDIF